MLVLLPSRGGASHQPKPRLVQGTSQFSSSTLTTLPMNKASQKAARPFPSESASAPRPEQEHHRVEQQQNEHVLLPGRRRLARSAPAGEPLLEAGMHDTGVKFLHERRRLLDELMPLGRIQPSLEVASVSKRRIASQSSCTPGMGGSNR